MHGLTVLPEQREAMGSMLGQLRFLRGVEIGFGLLMLAVQNSFFERGERRSDVNRAVLGGLVAIPAARTVSLLLDGPPPAEFTAMLIAEWALVLWMRRATEPSTGHEAAQERPT